MLLDVHVLVLELGSPVEPGGASQDRWLWFLWKVYKHVEISKERFIYEWDAYTNI